MDALVTGHVVYYTARMKRCKHRGTVRNRRVTIGDYVDVYEIENDYNLKEPHSYISFSSSKVVHSDLGKYLLSLSYGPRQANLVLIAYASSEGSGEPAHPRSLARTFAARSYKQ